MRARHVPQVQRLMEMGFSREACELALRKVGARTHAYTHAHAHARPPTHTRAHTREQVSGDENAALDALLSG